MAKSFDVSGAIFLYLASNLDTESPLKIYQKFPSFSPASLSLVYCPSLESFSNLIF